MNNDPLKTARDILAEMTDCHERSMDDIMATTQVGILAALIALCERLDHGLIALGGIDESLHEVRR